MNMLLDKLFQLMEDGLYDFLHRKYPVPEVTIPDMQKIKIAPLGPGPKGAVFISYYCLMLFFCNFQILVLASM